MSFCLSFVQVLVTRVLVQADYFNSTIAEWEPMLEPWPVTVNGRMSEDPVFNHKAGSLSVKSPSELDLNLSQGRPEQHSMHSS